MVTPLDQRPRSGPYSGLNARSAKRFLTQAFLEADLPFAEDDALEIVLAATGFDKTALMLRGAEFLDPGVFEVITNHMQRRLSGEPVDHILGWREFYGRRFKISKDVLSPRSDTETLIRDALRRLDSARPAKLLDLGTGSGAIGLTLLSENALWTLHATDISDAALQIARSNADALELLNRVNFFTGEWYKAVPTGETYDMIVSNPPYITNSAMESLETEVIDYDPDIALRGGRDGLEAYRDIIAAAPDYLKSGGWLGLEIGYDQAEALKSFLSGTAWDDVSVNQDLSGHDRTVWARKKS
jgi:release factor glutamine methyltransferase